MTNTIRECIQCQQTFDAIEGWTSDRCVNCVIDYNELVMAAKTVNLYTPEQKALDDLLHDLHIPLEYRNVVDVYMARCLAHAYVVEVWDPVCMEEEFLSDWQNRIDQTFEEYLANTASGNAPALSIPEQLQESPDEYSPMLGGDVE